MQELIKFHILTIKLIHNIELGQKEYSWVLVVWSKFYGTNRSTNKNSQIISNNRIKTTQFNLDSRPTKMD